MKQFNDVHTFITGGSSGIGKALALELARRGAHIHIAARNPDRLDAALAELETARQNPEQVLSAHPLDITDVGKVKQVVGELAPQLVINNAGAVAQQLALEGVETNRPGYFDITAPEVYRRLVEVNYLGAVNVCLAAAPHLRRGAHVVNVATGVVVVPLSGYAAYAGSKGALLSFSEILRLELKPRGVRVSVAYPPDTDTPQHRAELNSRAPETDAVAGLASVMSPERVAELILRGVRRGAFHIPVGLETALIFRLLRPLEWAKFLLLDTILACARWRGGQNRRNS